MVVNLVTTAGLYIPILKQLSSFFSKTVKYEKYNNKNVDLQLATSQEEKSSKLEIDNISMNYKKRILILSFSHLLKR